MTDHNFKFIHEKIKPHKIKWSSVTKPLMSRIVLNPKCIGGREGGKIGHATQNLVKSARVRTMITLL